MNLNINSQARHVVVATTTRDLWYGTLAGSVGPSVTLREARHIYHFTAHENKNARGVGSLASHGLAKGSRIGAVVPEIYLASVSGVMVCSPEDVAAFTEATWGA